MVPPDKLRKKTSISPVEWEVLPNKQKHLGRRNCRKIICNISELPWINLKFNKGDVIYFFKNKTDMDNPGHAEYRAGANGSKVNLNR